MDYPEDTNMDSENLMVNSCGIGRTGYHSQVSMLLGESSYYAVNSAHRKTVIQRSSTTCGCVHRKDLHSLKSWVTWMAPFVQENGHPSRGKRSSTQP